MQPWRAQLRFDPLPPLLSSGDEALRTFARRDLLDEPAGPVDRLWQLPGARKILRAQRPDGAWPPRGARPNSATNYALVETWKQLRTLVDVFGLTRDHPGARAAAEYVLSCQTEEGDIRGMLANQYAPYYTGALLGLLVSAGYAGDPRVERGFQWLLSVRQDDGGWTVPLLTHKLDRRTWLAVTGEYAEPLPLDRSQPFSHNATGMILRAFAAHPEHRRTEAARTAAGLLAYRFFRPDAYTSYRAASYWIKFQYPFWWNNLVAALDSISRIGLSPDDGPIAAALRWLADHQQESGLWRTSYAEAGGRVQENPGMRGMAAWVSLAVCRVFKRFYADP
jgi:hypothetical protein